MQEAVGRINSLIQEVSMTPSSSEANELRGLLKNLGDGVLSPEQAVQKAENISDKIPSC